MRTFTPARALSLGLMVCGAVSAAGCDSGEASVPPSEPHAEAVPDDAPAPVDPTLPLVIYRGAELRTAAGMTLPKGELWVRGDRIAAVGTGLEAPEDAQIVEVQGVITPGIIDTHSHIGVYASPGLRAHSDGNEAVAPVTAYARARDGYWPQDPQIDLARAGGVTTMQILPGSANLIGGRSTTVRLLPNARSVADVHFPGAPDGLKMACGENPKRVYGEKGGPQTRMGNVAGYRRAFQQALEYKRVHEKAAQAEGAANGEVQDPSDAGAEDGSPQAPPRDLGLETLAGVLAGEILVHNHCYRADEMSGMLELADEFGFKIRSFHHAVEAYKIADRLATTETSASIWADWWGFKAEAYDSVRANAAMVSAAGARAIIHSDSAVGIQRLNQEAAKAMHAGRRAGIEISEEEALRWITINAAWALGIDQQVGTLEEGKRADFVLWDGNPFSVYAKAQKVFIDGTLVYDRLNGDAQPHTDFGLGLRPDQNPVTMPAPVAKESK